MSRAKPVRPRPFSDGELIQCGAAHRSIWWEDRSNVAVVWESGCFHVSNRFARMRLGLVLQRLRDGTFRRTGLRLERPCVLAGGAWLLEVNTGAPCRVEQLFPLSGTCELRRGLRPQKPERRQLFAMIDDLIAGRILAGPAAPLVQVPLAPGEIVAIEGEKDAWWIARPGTTPASQMPSARSPTVWVFENVRGGEPTTLPAWIGAALASSGRIRPTGFTARGPGCWPEGIGPATILRDRRTGRTARAGAFEPTGSRLRGLLEGKVLVEG